MSQEFKASDLEQALGSPVTGHPVTFRYDGREWAGDLFVHGYDSETGWDWTVRNVRSLPAGRGETAAPTPTEGRDRQEEEQ